MPTQKQINEKHGEAIETLTRYENLHERTIQSLEKQIARANNVRDGIKARSIFTVASLLAIAGGWGVNTLLHMDGGYSHIQALIITVVGGAVAAGVSSIWLSVYSSMGE